jgi:hypothetical protein
MTITGLQVTPGMVSELVRQADQLLAAAAPTVMEKAELPPSGDRHDYLSMAPYWWRNPDTPDGMPYIQRDGHFNPEMSRIPDKNNLYRLIGSVWTLAVGYSVSGRLLYAVKAAELIRAWFLDPATRMKPNLEFAQGVPGVTAGRPAGLIETRELGRVLEAARRLEGSVAWTAKDAEGLRAWAQDFLHWMLDSTLGRQEAAAANNHSTWYHVQATALAAYAGDESSALSLAGKGGELIENQIAAGGAQPEELRRANSWHYSLFNLLGHFRLADLGSGLGLDLWTHIGPSGAGLRDALEFLLPHGLRGEAWPLSSLPPLEADAGALRELLYLAWLRYQDEEYAAGWRSLSERDGLIDLSPLYLGEASR